MSIQITYRLILKKEQNKEGLYPVYLRAFLKGEKIEIATSVTIPARDWSAREERVKTDNRKHVHFNAILEAFEKKTSKIILRNFTEDESPLTLRELKERILSMDKVAVEGNFTDYISNYLDENKGTLGLETYTGYKSQISKLLKFKSQVLFSDLTEKFIKEYHAYMLNTLKNNENTAGKSMRVLRTFVNICLRYKYLKRNPFEYHRIKKVDGKRDFLTKEELKVLVKSYEDGCYEKIEKEVLQYFLFACYTGLRYSDLKELKADDVKSDALQIRMQKTGQVVSIPLSKKAITFLPKNSRSDKAFFVYCNKVTNKTLKKIGIDVGLNKKLTCHVARHTFATVSISLGIPMEIVSKLLGHTNIRTTQIYAKVVDNVRDKEMQKWDL